MAGNGSKTYFMTGAAGGIGRWVADRLVERGDRLFATDLNVDPLRDHANQNGWPDDNVMIDTLDVRSAEAWDAAYANVTSAFGTVDVHMNFAGLMLPDFAEAVTDAELDLQIDVNLKGLILGTRTAAKHMIAAGTKGHIVNIASLAGVAPIPGLAVYSASKFGARGFSLVAASDLRKHGIDVTVICPDAIDTGLLKQSKSKDAGAMVFSANKLLTVDQIGEVIIQRALVSKPVEITYPPVRSILAKIGSLAPGLASFLTDGMMRKGLANQTKMGRKEESK
jgi:3-oxoacyl-[acyl-carrier protein] reductase